MMTVQIRRKKKLSQAMQDALDALAIDFEKLQPKVDRVFTIGRGEGLSDKEIGKLVREKMKEHYTMRTVQNVFATYPDAKQQQIHKKAEKTSTFHEDDKNEDEEDDAQKYRFYKETIATKNKLLKEKDEEINGLKKQLAQANKRITELESKLNKPSKTKKSRNIQQEKSDAITNALSRRLQEDW